MYIKVQVSTETPLEKVVHVKADEYIVWTKAKAQRNEANKAVVELLKQHLGITRIRIVSGHHSPSKIFDVQDQVGTGQ